MQEQFKPVQHQPSVIERLNKAFHDELMTKQFPVEKLSVNWRHKSKLALFFASPHSLGVSADVFMNLVKKDPSGDDYSLTFFEFAVLSNNLEMRSAFDLQHTNLTNYAALMVESMEYVKSYNDEVEKIRTDIQERIAMEDRMKKTAAGDRGPLSPVKGEA